MFKNLRSKPHFFDLIIFVLLILVLGISLSLFSFYSFAGMEIDKGIRVAQLSTQPTFKHDSTSFPLSGAHRTLECFQCHSGGRYRGTPRTCETCHNGQITYGKPAGHLRTTQSCLVCHSVNAWSPSNFIHDASTAGQCSNCHNGSTATGKPANHLSTTSQCDTCHTTRAWTPAGFNHASIGGLLCSSCHKAGGQGMPPKNDTLHNISGLPDCKQCHSSTSSFSVWTMNHTGISPPTPCATCHIAGNSMGAVSTPSIHPYAASNSDCSQCHTNFTTFAGAAFNHTGVTTCKTCHFSGNSTGAMPPPVTAGDLIHNPLSNIITDCNSCHTSTQPGGFASYNMVHSAISNYATTCQNCHKAGNPMGAVYKANHNVGVICGNCHNTTSFSN